MPDRTPFDELAGTYDESFTSSLIGQMQRRRVWQYLMPLCDPEKPLSILDINCGTGEDAIRLAHMGHRVTATDASEMMIGKAKQKEGADTVSFMTCPFNQLTSKLRGQQFDLVLSNFGGLNCISTEELKELEGQLSSLTFDNAKVILVVMGRCCLWEIFHYSSKGRLGKAFRRMRSSTNFNMNGSSIRIYYHAPKKIRRIFSAEFASLAQYPVGLFIPPSYLEKKFESKLQKLEKLYNKELSHSPAWAANYADHYCIIFEKNRKDA